MERQRTNLISVPTRHSPSTQLWCAVGVPIPRRILNCEASAVSGGPKVWGLIGVHEMKSRVSRIMRNDQVQSNETVRAEMQTFLAALVSYPDRFAANPHISFEQHRTSLMMPAQDPRAMLQNPD